MALAALRALCALLFAVFAGACGSRAQQPFYTDDSDVATRHHWHLETNNEFDFLPAAVRPNLRQDTQTVKFSYGLFENVEIGMDFPVLAIFNAANSGLGTPIGLGDSDFSIKYRLRKEKEGSRAPALTVSLNIEPPTGERRKQLGSGLTDYYLNGILQKSISAKNTLRINGGATFAGNTLTGAIGIRGRGTVITGGSSVTHQFTRKLDLGFEVYGGHGTRKVQSRGALQEQIGGNYEIRRGLTIDFGAVAGQAVGSPRFGLQLGLSKDF